MRILSFLLALHLWLFFAGTVLFVISINLRYWDPVMHGNSTANQLMLLGFNLVMDMLIVMQMPLVPSGCTNRLYKRTAINSNKHTTEMNKQEQRGDDI